MLSICWDMGEVIVNASVTAILSFDVDHTSVYGAGAGSKGLLIQNHVSITRLNKGFRDKIIGNPRAWARASAEP